MTEPSEQDWYDGSVDFDEIARARRMNVGAKALGLEPRYDNFTTGAKEGSHPGYSPGTVIRKSIKPNPQPKSSPQSAGWVSQWNVTAEKYGRETLNAPKPAPTDEAAPRKPMTKAEWQKAEREKAYRKVRLKRKGNK